MMVSTRGRYALRLIIDIAKQGQAGALVTMRQSAEQLGLSVKYLERPPAEICIGDVLRATEGSCMPVSCLDDEAVCERVDACEAREFWRGMGDAITDYMDSMTLADVLNLAKSKSVRNRALRG